MSKDIPEMEGFASHLVPLLSAVMQTSGRVCELGCGGYSTPILHELCCIRRDEWGSRELLSADNSPDWFEHFKAFQCSHHNVVLVEDWDAFFKEHFDGPTFSGPRWDVVFVDHAPGDRRAPDIFRVGRYAQWVVVHDSNVGDYNYEPAFKTFTYRTDYQHEVLHTTILSNLRPFYLMAPTPERAIR